LDTPTFPEYTAGHPGNARAAAEILQRFLGDVTFSTQTASAPNGPRSFTSFIDMANQISESRILAGVHFRTSNHHAQNTGRDVAHWVYDRLLLPVGQK